MTSAVSTLYICHILFVLFSVCAGGPDTDARVCQMCEASIRRHSPVWEFCTTKGFIKGRCCFENNTTNTDTVIGLDLANCSISQIESMSDASTAVIIDLSYNPISNLSGFIFQSFSNLTQLILPIKVDCPGSNASWERVEIRENSRVCEGQRNVCNLTAQMSWYCPENSFCKPYGPGFFECSCLDKFHGYKCMRQGEFPVAKVLGILTASTVVASVFLWFTQRRKAKTT